MEKDKDYVCRDLQEMHRVGAKSARWWREVRLCGWAEGAPMGVVVLIRQAKKLGHYLQIMEASEKVVCKLYKQASCMTMAALESSLQL